MLVVALLILFSLGFDGNPFAKSPPRPLDVVGGFTADPFLFPLDPLETLVEPPVPTTFPTVGEDRSLVTVFFSFNPL